MAEKAAWRAARGRDLKLVTVCPALVTGPGFRRRNSTSSIAYLKGKPLVLFLFPDNPLMCGINYRHSSLRTTEKKNEPHNANIVLIVSFT